MARLWHAFALVMVIAGCASPIPATAPGSNSAGRTAPEEFATRRYEQAAAQGRPVYRVASEGSLVTILVRRGGSLAHLGHDHVVASHGVQGYAATDDGSADLYVPLADLSVDEPALRTEAGLDTQPSEADIAGTRSNMLDKVLDTQRFPFALIHIDSRDSTPDGIRLNVTIQLHGVSRSFDVPARWQVKPGEMDVAGSFDINQSDFGLTPFSVLGGAIQVQDRLSVRFRILARRVDARS
jgi:hypothetical protein